MANILFVVVENLRQYHGSPPLQGSVLHLVYESKVSNKSLNRTARWHLPPNELLSSISTRTKLAAQKFRFVSALRRVARARPRRSRSLAPRAAAASSANCGGAKAARRRAEHRRRRARKRRS